MVAGRIVLGLLCVTALAVSCAQPQGAEERPAPRTHTVVIEGMRFRPDTLTINAGDSVIWVNRDIVPHSATSAAASFDSGVIAADQEWRLTIEHRGDFEYICSFHPTMKATLHVR
jgi:plastocyanin